MSQQSEMADAVYGRMSEGPVPAADLARQIHERWGPEHSVGAVHGFVAEVANCLLRDDVELGDVIDGRFAPWGLAPWDAHERFERELFAMDGLLDDETRYVFRRTPKI